MQLLKQEPMPVRPKRGPADLLSTMGPIEVGDAVQVSNDLQRKSVCRTMQGRGWGFRSMRDGDGYKIWRTK
jgi:hypothetical protein